jgi:peptidoglycan hydrolase CwlO-like protein
MEEALMQILTRLEKLDKMELDISAIKNDVKKIDKKVDSITEVVAKTMEDVTELKRKAEKQDIEIRVIKGVKKS